MPLQYTRQYRPSISGSKLVLEHAEALVKDATIHYTVRYTLLITERLMFSVATATQSRLGDCSRKADSKRRILDDAHK